MIFLWKTSSYVNDEKSAFEFVKSFTVKDAMWSAANALKEINSEALKNDWHDLLPTILFNDDEDDNKWDFEGFHFSGKEAIFLNS